MDESRQVWLDPSGIGSRGMYELLWAAVGVAHPSWRHLPTTHWVMNLEWYKAIRRASLRDDADDDARDETKWEPDPADMVLGWYIVVTEDGDAPYLADGRSQHTRELFSHA
jgi:hypothetical protein